MMKHSSIYKLLFSCLALIAAAITPARMQASPVGVNTFFQGGVFGSFNINYVEGYPGVQLQQIRFDLQNPLFLDPTFSSPGALLPFAFGSVVGAAETGFAGVSGVFDGSTSFTLSFNDFDNNEEFSFGLDVDSPCAGFSCQIGASLVTGPEFAGTTITGTFGGPQFQTTEFTGSFIALGPLTAKAVLRGDVAPVPEPQTVGMIMAGLATLGLRLRRRR